MDGHIFWIVMKTADGELHQYEGLTGEVVVGEATNADVPILMGGAGAHFRIVSSSDGPQVLDLTPNHSVTLHGQIIQRPVTLADGTKLMLPGFTALYVFTSYDSYARYLDMWLPVQPPPQAEQPTTPRQVDTDTEPGTIPTEIELRQYPHLDDRNRPANDDDAEAEA